MRRELKRSVTCDEVTWQLARETADKLSEREDRYVSISSVIRRGILLVATQFLETQGGEACE